MQCGSWIIISIKTGEVVRETFSYKAANSINREKYKVLCAYEYLTEMNASIKLADKL